MTSNNHIVMTQEQFSTLLQSITTSMQQQLVTPPPTTAQGNFSKCSSRFDGSTGADVEAFIDAVSVYKDCCNVTDDNALKGLSMLFTGLASTWWHGIKPFTRTYNDAIVSLRAAFGQKVPAYQVYRNLFAKEQEPHTSTDIFVCHARAQLAQLPAPTLPESVQLDMVYGLLRRDIRQGVPRDSIATFDALLKAARTVEESRFVEDKKPSPRSESHGSAQKNHRRDRPRCTFCNNIGHVQKDCRNYARSQRDASAPQKTTSTNATEENETTRVPLACYGCGALGVIKSQCPNCRKSSSSTAVSSLEFNAVETTTNLLQPRQRPILYFSVMGSRGCGLVDTAAKTCVAGQKLYQLLLKKNQQFVKARTTVTLADGIESSKDILVTKIDVHFYERVIATTFIVLPDALNNRTLLGINFLEDASIAINIPARTWHFCDQPTVFHELSFETDDTSSIGASAISMLRDEEGQMLNDEECDALNSLLQESEEVFGPLGEPTQYAEHRIEIGDHAPIAVPPYRMPAAKKEILRKEIDTMLSDGIIEDCESPWAAPVVLVPKKNDEVRVCVDYRRLNAITVSDKYPMPRIDGLIHLAKQTLYMSTIDLRSGYWQVKVRECDKDKTAFSTPFGMFRFCRMPFGLKNAGATFQRLIDRFRSGLKDITIFAYLDDLILVSDSFNKHLRDLQAVFARLQQFGLRAKRDKCFFARASVKFLGHVITTHGLEMDPDKVSAIQGMAPPRNVKHVRSFLQTCSWYRRFVPNFSAVAKPLSDLTKNDARWEWEQRQQLAFEKLKEALTTAPVLRQIDETLPFVIRTDASNYALGAVLLQGEEPEERPVEYASRLLSPAEKNYNTTEREALAVVWAVGKFRGYIEGGDITVGSDHQALRWLMSLKSPTGRLARWALALQPYNLKIMYVPGKSNIVADTLSRPPCSSEDKNACGVCIVAVEMPSRGATDIRRGQLSDSDVKKIIDVFETPEHTELANWTGRGYLMSGGVLYRYAPDQDSEEAQLIVPEAERALVMAEYHDAPTAGHYGVDRTLQRVAARFYWPGMRKYVAEYVKDCIKCQRYKASNLKPAGLLRTPAAAQRFETIAVDLFGPLPTTPSGHRWIFIVEDVATKWVEIFPLTDATSEACAKILLEEVVLRYGTPRRMISDNGVQFVSSVMQYVTDCLGIEQVLTPVYHPEANPVERKNRDMKSQLAMLVGNDHLTWAGKLPAVRFAMNSVCSQSTGHSAAFLTFGRELRTPDDVLRDLRAVVSEQNFVPLVTPRLQHIVEVMKNVREVHESEQDRRKKYADAKRRDTPIYKPGDLVLVQSHILSSSNKGVCAKLGPKRNGPYRILQKKSATTYEVAAIQQPDVPVGRYHTSALTPFAGRESESVPQPAHPIRRRGRPPKIRPGHPVSSPRRKLRSRGGDL